MLTVTRVRNAKARVRPYKVFDGGGLFLAVQPTGKKWWRLKYRFDRKEKLISLGVYPDVSLQEARRRCGEARQLLANGVNPSTKRKAAQADNTGDSFETVAREWFSSKTPNWVPTHSSMVLMRLEKYAFPALGTRSIADIGPQDIHAVLKPIEKAKKYETAKRVLTVCHQVFDYALFSERITRNPAAPVKQLLTKPKTDHFPAVIDPKAVGKLLRMLDAYEGSPVVMAALRLAPIVFTRPGELRQAKWDDVNLDAAEWRFVVTKTHTPHIVPLSEQAVAILRALQPLTGQQTDEQPYVFPGTRNNGRPMSENTLAVAMRTMGVAQGTHTIHGWRATARTLLDEQLHFPPHQVEHQLAHQVRDPLGRSYNRTTHLAERKQMMQRWADYLDALRTKTTP